MIISAGECERCEGSTVDFDVFCVQELNEGVKRKLFGEGFRKNNKEINHETNEDENGKKIVGF